MRMGELDSPHGLTWYSKRLKTIKGFMTLAGIMIVPFEFYISVRVYFVFLSQAALTRLHT